MDNNKYLVAVIGAGPAGLYAAKQLAANGANVVLFNRDVKPGGLAEYGIYYDKYKMKIGLRKQFGQILEMPGIRYYGNVTLGRCNDLTLEDLRSMGFQGIMVTVGAQGTKWLGLPGEDLTGVYHAKDIVYHYNKLPPFSEQEFLIGKRAAIIGVGNVMLDIARWLIRDIKIDEVIAVARRGPAEVKFTKKEMQSVALNLDLDALDAEIERVKERMLAVDQDPGAAKDFILSALDKAYEKVSDTRLRFEFLSSPGRILGDPQGRVCGLEIEDTELALRNGDTKAVRLGTKRELDVDTVIFCIGDRVDEDFGLPVKWNAFIKNPDPDYPIDGISYEAFDPDSGKPIEGVFVAGWSREASSGLVGVARKDGETGARAVLEYLKNKDPIADPAPILEELDKRLTQEGCTVVSKADVHKLFTIEKAKAESLGLEDYKMKTNKEMLAAIEES